MAPRADQIRAAEIVLPCTDLDETQTFFLGLGFRLESIAPADDPSAALLTGHGLRLRLDREHRGAPGHIRLLCADPATLADGATELQAPNGTRIELRPADPPLELPPARPTFELARASDPSSSWVTGRAGMRYRDLLPTRQAGRFIASHIQIAQGGPVADYVHYHDIRFQMIYCRRGWARLVYEDQGEPFLFEPGDCVLQPPRIRHRVLESSPGLEVIEITSPARHETHADHDLTLPTPRANPARDFGGQRFTRHRAASSPWTPWRHPGYEARDLGLAGATAGLATAQVIRAIARRRDRTASVPSAEATSPDAELYFALLLAGAVTFERPGERDQRLAAGDALALPPAQVHRWTEATDDLELLEVIVPARASAD